jgi:hypothetical protein
MKPNGLGTRVFFSALLKQLVLGARANASADFFSKENTLERR